jgi:arylsulfatase
MEVFAGFMAQADHEVGRVIDAFRQTGQLDNTLVIYIAGDNGASLEGGLYGTDNLMEQINGLQSPADQVLSHLDDIGGPLSNPHYPVGWAWAGNTPFQWGKRFGSHLGGTRDPMVVSWPRHIRNAGGTRSQYAHVIDVFPTILQTARIPQPRVVNGVEQLVVDGVSFFDTLTNASAAEHHARERGDVQGRMGRRAAKWSAPMDDGSLARPASLGAVRSEPRLRGSQRPGPSSSAVVGAPAEGIRSRGGKE